jgi:hypothetical protein
VAEAIDHVQPFGVDVSSGVEAAPGIKDPRKVTQFLLNARAAFEHVRSVRLQADGASSVRLQADGASSVRLQADGATSARPPADERTLHGND